MYWWSVKPGFLSRSISIEKFITIPRIEYSMCRISNIEVAILGLLCELPRYGYEIEKTIEERNMRNWTEIGFSSIYYVLKKLEEKELIRSKVEVVENKPPRKVYTVTDEGYSVMKKNVKQLLSSFERVISAFDLGLMNMSLLDKGEVIECFGKYLRSIDDTLVFLNDSKCEMEGFGLPEHVIALATRPLAHVHTERKWVEDYTKNVLEKEESI